MATVVHEHGESFPSSSRIASECLEEARRDVTSKLGEDLLRDGTAFGHNFVRRS